MPRSICTFASRSLIVKESNIFFPKKLENIIGIVHRCPKRFGENAKRISALTFINLQTVQTEWKKVINKLEKDNEKA